MKTIKLTERELEYLRYIVNGGFVVCDSQPNKEYKKELRTLKRLQRKIN